MDEQASFLKNADPRLPNFFLLGASKAGTTTLYALLRQHPEIYLPEIKEPHFFSNDYKYEKGINYYLSSYYSGAADYLARGDATPHYLFFEKAAERISHHLPLTHQRFIVILRDPVSRAYSLYWNMVREGVEVNSFRRALELEEERSKDSEIIKQGTVCIQYVASSLYAAQLNTYFRYFSHEQFLILLQEDLACDPNAVMKEVFRFLGVQEDIRIRNTEPKNQAAGSRSVRLQRFLRKPHALKHIVGRFLSENAKYRIYSKLYKWNSSSFFYPPLEREVRQQLYHRFRDDILKLESLLGRNLRHWYDLSNNVEGI